MIELESSISDNIISIFIVFCRLGSSLMIIPGIADSYVGVRTRLTFALALSIITAPVIDLVGISLLPAKLITVIIKECIIGIFIGLVTKIILSATNIFGTVIATLSGLGSAMLFDPTQNTQGAIIGNLLGMIAILMIFLTDTHHLLIKLITQSYDYFKVNDQLLINDYTDYLIKVIKISFDLAIKLVAAQLIAIVLLLISAGILSKLIPVIQIFFLITPVQVMISFVILFLTLPSLMNWYIEYLNQFLYDFVK